MVLLPKLCPFNADHFILHAGGDSELKEIQKEVETTQKVAKGSCTIQH